MVHKQQTERNDYVIRLTNVLIVINNLIVLVTLEWLNIEKYNDTKEDGSLLLCKQLCTDLLRQAINLSRLSALSKVSFLNYGCLYWDAFEF